MKRAVRDAIARAEMWKMWNHDENTVYSIAWEKIYNNDRVQPAKEDAAKRLLFLLFALTRGSTWE